MTQFPLSSLKFKGNYIEKDLSLISGGENSKAYVFCQNKEKFVLRINDYTIGFIKDQYAYQKFSKLIPIPEILEIGNLDDKYYAISRFCEGKSINKPMINSLLAENIVKTINLMKNIDVEDSTGFGVASEIGKANKNSWKDWVFREETPVVMGGKKITWKDIRNKKYVDLKLIDSIEEEIKKYLKYIPQNRKLIHGDFGTGNIMCNNNKITGILDWNEFGYGDFLYDLAYFDFWLPKTMVFEIGERVFSDEKYFKERIYCHQLFAGLTAMSIYAGIEWIDGYKNTENKLKQILTIF